MEASPQDNSRFFKIFQDFSRFFKIFQDFSRFFKIFQDFSRFFKIFQDFSANHDDLTKFVQTKFELSLNCVLISPLVNNVRD